MKKIFSISAILIVSMLITFPACWKTPTGPTPIPTATVDADNSNDFYEPDNTTGTAAVIVSGAAAQHHNMFDGTDDYYKFCASAGSAYQIRAIASASCTYFGDFSLWDGVNDYELFAQSQDNRTCVMTIHPAASGDFHFRSSRNNSNGPAKGYDISVVKLPSSPVDFNTSVDNQSLTFTFSGSADWYGQGDIYSVNSGAAQSPYLKNTQTAAFSTTVTGPCTVTFKWKVSCEYEQLFGPSDNLGFIIDGVYMARIYGEPDWADYSYTITGAGAHTLSWEYFKDGNQTLGYDAGWVDDIKITPN
jgi:hypothetical protein